MLPSISWIHPLLELPAFHRGHLASLAGTTNGVKSYTIGDKTVDLEGNVGSIFF